MYRAENRSKSVMWHCCCDCGNERDVKAASLVKGVSTSCGCYHLEKCSEIGKKAGAKRGKDLSGQVFNNVKVIGVHEGVRGAGKHIQWDCICPICKKVFHTGSNHLIAGEVSCCKHCNGSIVNKPPHTIVWQVGRRCGCWTVVGKTNHQNSWFAKCECGNVRYKTITELSNAPAHCECGIIHSSTGEEKIAQWLTNHAIDYTTQQSFKTLRNKHPLRFDFFIISMNVCIEFDGKQHYHPIEHWGGEERLKEYKMRDMIKTQWCKENGIYLIRIRYDENVAQRLAEEMTKIQDGL